MATFRIHEFAGTGYKGGSVIPVYDATQAQIAQTAITTSGTSQQSAAFNANTTIINVQTDGNVYISIGANPTAASTTIYLPITSGFGVDFVVNAGDKIAVIDA